MIGKDVGRSSPRVKEGRDKGLCCQCALRPACLWLVWVGFVIKSESWENLAWKSVYLEHRWVIRKIWAVTRVHWCDLEAGENQMGAVLGLHRASLVTWQLECSRYCSESDDERFKVLILMKSQSRNVCSECPEIQILRVLLHSLQ